MPTCNPTSDQSPTGYPSLSQLSAGIPPVSWLWPGWIPRGMITLLCAAPGAGKSYLALDLAHRLIAGLPWPDGAPPAPPDANVIYVDAEAAPQLLIARALAWGMDCSRLFPMLADHLSAPNQVAPDRVLDLNARACQDRLLKMAAALRPALIIVDSLGSASRSAESQVAAVDALFAFLNDIAIQFQCAMLLIHHLRKRGAVVGGPRAGAALGSDDVRGSGHIVSLARSVLGLAAVQITLDPEPNAPRRLQLLKTNLGPHPSPLGVTFVPSGGVSSGGVPSGGVPSGGVPSGGVPSGGVPSGGVPSGGVPTGTGATNLAYGPAPEPIYRRTTVESCARWLLDVLALERRPMRPNELERPARRAGYSRATLFRARDLLGSQVVDTHVRHSPFNRWALAAPPAPTPSSQS